MEIKWLELISLGLMCGFFTLIGMGIASMYYEKSVFAKAIEMLEDIQRSINRGI